jgi:quinol-cytochrome oxidoreductase complex cytochrome b subunit
LRTLIFLLLPVVLLGAGLFAPLWDASRSRSDKERALTIRMTIFAWMIGIILVAAMIMMPNKGRVMMLVPVFVAAVLLGRLWKRARVRAQREREEAELDLERMKRAN